MQAQREWLTCPGLCRSLMPLGLVRWSTAHSSSGRLCHSASPLLFWLNSQWNLLKLLHLGCWDYSATIWTPGSSLLQGEASFPVYFSHCLMPTSVTIWCPPQSLPDAQSAIVFLILIPLPLPYLLTPTAVTTASLWKSKSDLVTQECYNYVNVYKGGNSLRLSKQSYHQ